MKNKVRIGKDFTIRWALLTSEGEPYAINADAAILRIYSPYGAKEAIGFVVSGNVIEWVFKGKDQKHLGDYTIELVENNGRDGMLSVDFVEAFTLVAHTNEESLNDEGAVEIQTIELTSQIALAPVTTGGGSYDDTKIKQDIADLQAKDKATDAELAELSAEIEHQGIFIEDLQNTKIDRENDDYYPKMAVGLADNLAGVDVVDSEINFRRSGGGAISDGVARIESIKGNSVVWNQLFNKGVNTNGEVWDNNLITINVETTTAYDKYDNNADAERGSISHKYLQEVVKVSGTVSQGSIKWYSYAFGGFVVIDSNTPNGVIMQKIGSLLYDNAYWSYRHYEANTIANGLIIRQIVYNLTQMFGAGNEPTTIEEFYARIPMGVDLNAYNEGEVIHMDVQSIESVGVNQWDEEREEGYYDVNNGQKKSATSLFRSVNHFRILPNNEYYLKGTGIRILYYDANMNYISYAIKSNGIVTSPPNACYASIFGEEIYYSTDICINLSDTSINGKYFPYIKRVEDLSIIRKYFPQGMKSAGTAHDEIRYNKASGKWEYSKGRLKAVDMGTLNWTLSSTYPSLFYAKIADIRPSSSNGVAGNVLTSKYVTLVRNNIHDYDKSCTLDNVYNVFVKDSAYTDAASFKASLQGVILYFEAAEWEWVELDEEDQFKDLDYQVWNGGTEKAIAEGKSAALAADITYGFNAIGKIKELESLVAALRSKVGI